MAGVLTGALAGTPAGLIACAVARGLSEGIEQGGQGDLAKNGQPNIIRRQRLARQNGAGAPQDRCAVIAPHPQENPRMGDGSASLPLAYCAPSSAYDLKVPMHLRASHFAFSPLVALSSLLLTPAAQAITFERLAANGAGTGIFFTPQASDWIFAPAAGETSV